MKAQIFISVIVTTYNWPRALAKVLQALAAQSYNNFEVIIADDGSTHQTYDYIVQSKSKYSFMIKHVWQPDEGFQAAKIRNKAVAVAHGKYLIFLDGDCLPLQHFILRHQWLAQSNWFVAGNRILLAREFSEQLLAAHPPIYHWPLYKWLITRKVRYFNRIAPLLFLPLFPRKLQSSCWQGAKTCNLGVWKEDFLAVNGFDEAYRGWGYEDSDLIIRLLQSGIKRKEGCFAVPVLHLWHPRHNRMHEQENYERLQLQLLNNTTQAATGVSQYLGEKEWL